MMALAITTNLLPVFLTTIASDLGKGTLLSAEQLGRIGAVTFIGLVGGILVTGPLADRWGGRIFAVGGNGLIAMGLATLHWTIDYPMLLGAAFIGGVGGGILDMILSPIVSSLTRGQSQTPRSECAALLLLCWSDCDHPGGLARAAFWAELED